MVDLTDKGSESEEMSCKTPERLTSDGSNVKTCVDCGTSKTPLWRGGPAGPKSLCNACGIRSRKKRRALMGVTEKKTKKATNGKPILQRQQSNTSESSTSSSGDCTSPKIGGLGVKNQLWSFGKDLGLQRPRSNTNQRRRMGEVEKAAFLLMALSCGSVYA